MSHVPTAGIEGDRPSAAPQAGPLRVGLIANTFDNLFGAVAGGHVHFIEVAKRWPDFDVTVFAPELARTIISRELPNASFVAMPSGGRFIRYSLLRNLYRTITAVRRISVLRSCDVVIATSHFLPDVVPGSLAGRRSIVCVQHLLDSPRKRPGSFASNAISATFQDISLRFARRFAGALLVNRREVADQIRFRDAKRIYVITHGVEHLLDAERAIIGRQDGRVVYLGRVVETKGIEDLLSAWALVVDAVPRARLVIAGTGAPRYTESLRKLACELGVADSVEFCGFVTEEQKNRLLDSAMLFAFPSKEEGWGIVLAEAMAHGLPCVTYDLAAYRNVFIRGRRSVAVNDVGGFARHIAELLTDEAQRTELSAAALELSKTFSWDAAAAIERRAVVDVAADYARSIRR
jgi:glycosyltransferase involved in cell wall biosynthesis